MGAKFNSLRISVGAAAVVLALAGCAGPGGEGTDEPTTRQVEVEHLSNTNHGPDRQGLVVASSARSLREETGLEAPDSGDGTYVAACRGQKPTGGYGVRMESARLAKDRLELRLTLEDPQPTGIVTQALTTPCTAGFIEGVDPQGIQFTAVDAGGKELDWPVRRAS